MKVKHLISKFSPVLVAICTGLTSMSVSGAESSYEVRLGGTKTDNLLRSDLFPIDETIASVGLSLDLSQDSNRFKGDLIADLEHRKYIDNSFDNENIWSMDGIATFQFSPEVFHWVIADRYGQFLQDPFQADTIVNRENVNVFSTGPDFWIHFGSQMSLQLSARYEDNYFEVTPADNNAVTGKVSLIRSVSQRRNFSINATASNTEFDFPELYGNFDRRAAYFGFDSEMSRGKLSLQLGANELKDDLDSFTGPLVDVSLRRNLSSRTELTVAYFNRLTDAGDLFRRTGSVGRDVNETQAVNPTGDAYEVQGFSGSISRGTDTSNIYVSLYSEDEEYRTDSEFDGRRSGVRAGVSIFGVAWNAQFDLLVEEHEFYNSDLQNDDTEIRADIGRRLWQSIGIHIGYARLQRESTDIRGAYVENRYSLYMTYSGRP